ncbi:polar amino acid transport system substrate-binding protein [Haloechinothrix alba]|uniref:Polar amino acid transport system substrate-binding protein n=1 Tax=Haloechinothrix alba TaxID=664784 RepID=A0A238V0U2_9PSEU|nr:ABC transporter substrate-binding protein [Haloechinothrix alba]SNR27129.1 polar amino acid transport system substrate-binding protein [Haloechinothrix alba]
MARHPKLKKLAFVPAFALTLSLAACGDNGSDTDEADDADASAQEVDLVEPGKLTVCTNLPYEPFQFTEDGEVVGFDVDLMDLVADELGVEQEIVDIEFDVIQSGTALNAGQCDVGAAAMTILPEREENLDFSDPYFDEVLGLMVEKGSGVESLDDVREQGLSLGVQAGTTSLDHAEEEGFEPAEFPNSGAQLQALQAGTIDVALQDLPVVENTWLENPDIAEEYELAEVIDLEAQYGFGVQKDGNPELLSVINDVLAEAREDGTYAEIFEKWFGAPPTE